MSIEHIKRPKYKIVLNIDGINQLYENNELKEAYTKTCKELKVLGGLTRLNSEPYKFKTIDYNYNCNICYVIHCYIKNNVLNNSDDIIIEIINIIQQYEDFNKILDQNINKILNSIMDILKSVEIKTFAINDDIKNLMEKYNIELLYCENNGGIYNNRNKFILNKDEICETDSKGNYNYPWVLMLDDSDFCGFKNIGNNYIEDNLLEIYSNNDIWSYGMPSNPRSPGNISFWERIYKTKYLDNFVNLFGDMCDDGMNKIYSKIYKVKTNQHCKQFNETLRWCNYGDETKTTVHLNPPPIFKYGNIVNSYNPLTLQKDEQGNFNTKAFNIESDVEKSVLEYVLQRYYIVLINNDYIKFDCKITIIDKDNFKAILINKNEGNQNCEVDFNNVDLSKAKTDALPIRTGDNILIGYFINAGIHTGSYTNPLKHLLEIDNLSNYTFYGYVKDLYQKIKDKSVYGNQVVQFMKIQPFENRNDVLAISENVYYIKHNETINLKTTYVLRKFKNNADKTDMDEKITGENIKFKSLGGTYSIDFKIILLFLIILITIIIIIVIIKNKISINMFLKIKQ